MIHQLYVKTPLFLSSYFVTNAIVHNLAKQVDKVCLPVLPQFLPTINCLYANFANIITVPYLGKEKEQQLVDQHGWDVLDLRSSIQHHTLATSRHVSSSKIPVWWDRQLYEHMGMSYNERYHGFQLPDAIDGVHQLFDQLNPTGEPYVLWHNHTSHHMGGIHIDLASWRPAADLPERKIIPVTLGGSANFLDYVKLIELAEEIHVVPGCLFFLVDSILNRTSARLFFHDAREKEVIQVNSRWNHWRWNLVDYGLARQ